MGGAFERKGPWRLEEDVTSPGAKIYKQLWVTWPGYEELNSGSSEEQQELVTAGPFQQLPVCSYGIHCQTNTKLVLRASCSLSLFARFWLEPLQLKCWNSSSPPCTWEGNRDALKKISFGLYTKSSISVYSSHIKISILTTFLLINNNGKLWWNLSHHTGWPMPGLFTGNASKEEWQDWKWLKMAFPKDEKDLIF